MKPKLLLSLLLFITFAARAQQYSIGGIIRSAKGGKGIESVTVFLDGSIRATMTNANGEFDLPGIAPGTYQLMITMVGHAPIKKNIILRDKSAFLDTVLQVRPVMLSQVSIGGKSLNEKYYSLFLKMFLGESANAKSCKILNPNAIEFSTEKNLLKAYTDDFLIIENKNLGYRIKYLLRKFEYDNVDKRTFYEGESIFEDLPGTPEQKQKWAANRQKAYYGSLMHYLRALHANKTMQEGFLTYQLYSQQLPLVIGPNPIVTEQLINRVDSTFIDFRYKNLLYTIYDKKKAAAPIKLSKELTTTIDVANTGTIFSLDAQIDKRGSYSDYKKYEIHGYWAEKRLGDQLPLEYDPL